MVCTDCSILRSDLNVVLHQVLAISKALSIPLCNCTDCKRWQTDPLTITTINSNNEQLINNDSCLNANHPMACALLESSPTLVDFGDLPLAYDTDKDPSIKNSAHVTTQQIQAERQETEQLINDYGSENNYDSINDICTLIKAELFDENHEKSVYEAQNSIVSEQNNPEMENKSILNGISMEVYSNSNSYEDQSTHMKELDSQSCLDSTNKEFNGVTSTINNIAKLNISTRISNNSSTNKKVQKAIINCPYCKVYFCYCQKDLIFHAMSKHLYVRPYPCEDCSKTFVTRSNYRLHVRTVHSHEPININLKSEEEILIENNIQLPNINNVDVNQIQYRNSNFEESSKKKVKAITFKFSKCPHCPVIRQSYQLAKQIISLHSNLRPYSCEYCSCKFKSISNWKRHVRTVHKREFTSTGYKSEIEILKENGLM